MPSNSLFYYLTRVQRESGLLVSTSFPSSPDDQQQRVIDAINESLRYLNNKYYLAFQWQEYLLTSASGQRSYDLRNAPYSQAGWRVNRMARHGVIRYRDDYILDYCDYTSLDEYRPNIGTNSTSLLYSSTGESLILHPIPSGEQYRIRYYSTYIGTDASGATHKSRLSASDDLTMLQDEYEDALIAMAVAKVRLKDAKDPKYDEWKKRAEDWEKILYDMTQPGEDAMPRMMVRPFLSGWDPLWQYRPFGTPWENW